MTPLHRLLMRATCSPAAASAGESFRSWRAQVDPMTVEHASCDLFGLLDFNLTRHGISSDEHERWTGVRRRNWVHQSMVLGAFRPALAGLVTRIGPVHLMDCAAVMEVLPEPGGWRWLQTPGVCVPRKRLGDALDVLAHAGWARSRGGLPRGEVLETRSSMLLEKPGYPRLRLHWRFFAHAELEALEQILGSEAEQAEGYVEGCLVPNPATVALTQLWQSHANPPENPLLPLVDAARIIEANGNHGCWKRVPEILAAAQMERETGGDLYLVREAAGVALPDSLRRSACGPVGEREEAGGSVFAAYGSAFREWRRFRSLKPQSDVGLRDYAAHVCGLEVSLRNALRRALRR